MKPSPVTASEIADKINTPVTDARIEEQDGKKVVVPHQVGLSVDEVGLAQMLESGELEFSVPYKLELNKIAARWPAKAVAQFFYLFKNRQ